MSITSTQVMVAIKTMFSMKGLSFNQNWLRETVANNVNEEDLFGKVYNEYLNSDLKISGNRSLKPIIERKGVSVDCKEIFAVQMQYLFEVNTAPNIQLRRLRLGTLFWGDRADGNAEAFDDIKTRRFHLILSDGTDTITAIESTPIPELNTQLAPGTKLLLEGPMRYISNLLYLESRNVKVLGGGVKTMAISNCYENILLRSLDCAETDLPRSYQESGLRRENFPEIKETVELGSSGKSVYNKVKECDGTGAESNNIKIDDCGANSGHEVANPSEKNELAADNTNGISPHFSGFEPNAGFSGLHPIIKLHSTKASNLSTKIDGKLSNRSGENNSKRSSKRMNTRYMAGPKLNKNKTNENHGNGNIAPEKPTGLHFIQSLKLKKSHGELSVKNELTDKKFTGNDPNEGKTGINGLEDKSLHLSNEVVDTELCSKPSTPKHSETGSTFTRTEQNENHKIENIVLEKGTTDSHSTQPSNTLTEMDGQQSIKNETNVTEMSTPHLKHRASGSSTDNVKSIDRSKSNSRHSANSSDHHNKSLHGTSDKAKQHRANKRISDDDFESLYSDMKKKRNKLYDEKKILVKETEALRQKVDVTEKVLAKVSEEKAQFQQEISIREALLVEANSEKNRLVEELKVVCNREEALQIQVQSHETDQNQLRALLEAQLVTTTTVNDLLQQQMDNAKRYLKHSAKVSTENDSISHQTENTMSQPTTPAQRKTPSRSVKMVKMAKPYKCNYCDKRYSRMYTRSKHSRLHHKEEHEKFKQSQSLN